MGTSAQARGELQPIPAPAARRGSPGVWFMTCDRQQSADSSSSYLSPSTCRYFPAGVAYFAPRCLCSGCTDRPQARADAYHLGANFWMRLLYMSAT
jgi:hypothetical protein